MICMIQSTKTDDSVPLSNNKQLLKELSEKLMTSQWRAIISYSLKQNRGEGVETIDTYDREILMNQDILW